MFKHATMNRAYRLVWSELHSTWIAVAEFARTRGKRTSGGLAAAVLLALGANSAVAAGVPLPGALPTGGQIAAGQAAISSSGARMDVTQSSNSAIVNWDSFNIGSQAQVNIAQPSAAAVILNRVQGGDPSAIYGRLTANGHVFLTNPGGILFAPGAQVDVGGLVASSLGISDANFLAGKYNFLNTGGAGAVVNQGNINVANGGFVALIAPQVGNSGAINATGGSIGLAAGDAVNLDFDHDGMLSFQVNIAAAAARADNTGVLIADGGRVVMNAQARDALLSTVLNNDGVIRARSLETRQGEIWLGGGNSGVVSVTGTLDASGTSVGRAGGTVKVLGDKVGLFDQAKIDVSGVGAGGTALIGGNFQGKGPEQNASATYVGKDVKINADAVGTGDGGKVAVWADDVSRYYGSITARGGAQSGNGGFVETSGHNILSASGVVDASAPMGQAGTWLLDPWNTSISNSIDLTVGASPNFAATASGANVNAASIQSALNLGTSVTVTTGASGAEAGNLTVVGTTDVNGAVNINKSTGVTASLTLQAAGSIFMNAGSTIQATGAGNALNVTLNSRNNNGVATAAGAVVLDRATITTNGGNIILGGGSDPSTGSAVGTATDQNGVFILGATLNSGGGNISILGQGQTTVSGATDSGGVAIRSKGATPALVSSGSGNIIITGTGGVGTGVTGVSSNGVSINGYEESSATASTATVSSSGGNVTINGTGGAAGSGVSVANGGRVTASGAAGNIALTGSTGTGVGASGVDIGAGCAVCVSSTFVQNTATSGNIQITGTNTVSSANANNNGVYIHFAGSYVETTGGGTLGITGTSGAGGHGILVRGARVTSNTGDITLIGTGSSGAGNSGVSLDTEAAISGIGVIESTGSANIFITATAAAGGTGIISKNTEPAPGVVNRIGKSTMTGDITLTTDTADIATSGTDLTIAGQGNLFIQPQSTNTSIGLAGGAGTLNLTTAELGKIANGFVSITIGRADGTGAITFGDGAGPSAGYTFSDNLTLRNTGVASGGIVITDALSMGANNLTLNTSGDITSTGFTVATTGGVLTLNSANMSLGGLTTGAGLLTINNSGTASQSDVFAGSGGLTKMGAGTLILSQANTYTGGTVINGGTVQLNGAGVLASTEAVTLANAGSTLDINGNTQTIGALTGDANATVALGAGALTMSSTTNAVYQGVFTGTGASSLTKAGINTQTISGDSSAGFSGAVAVNGGTLAVTADGALGNTTGSTTVGALGYLDFQNVIYATTEAVTLNGGTLVNAAVGPSTFAGAVTLGGNSTVDSSGANNLTLSGVVSETGGPRSLTKVGVGTLTLSGANTYTGATTINAGTLIASNATALGTSAAGTTVASGGKLTINNVDLTTEAITVNGGTLSLAGATPSVAAVTFGAPASTLDYAGHTGTVAINQQATTATGITVITGFSNIASVVGNGALATITGADAGQAFNVTGPDAGTAGTLAFTGVGNLTGGTGVDSFTLANAGTLSGNVDGGITGANSLDLSAKLGAVAINQQTGKATDIAGTWSNIASVVGNGALATITGADAGQAFNVTGPDAGTAGTLAFTGV
ncbi:MAG: filamentous hemagglutinin N-terminal domain-containing protein, partial [Sulfuritalea sp.]|nr:filamentous hemagglutinin N-terminal domain-containing protein [Sulfuritalea sp.]